MLGGWGGEWGDGEGEVIHIKPNHPCIGIGWLICFIMHLFIA